MNLAKEQTSVINQIETKLENAFSKKQKSLSEIEVYDIFDLLGLNTPKRIFISIEDIPKADINKLLGEIPTEKIVLKISSHKTLHKTETGGIKICAKKDAPQIIRQMAVDFKSAEGILVCEFVPYTPFALGREMMIGARIDDAFGPVITLGVGGTDAESLTKALKDGLSPQIALVDTLKTDEDIKCFINSSWVYKYVSGNIRGGSRLAEDKQIISWIKTFAVLMSNFNDSSKEFAIEEMEVNPLVVSGGTLFALDGVLRFRKPAKIKRDIPSPKGIWSLLKPKTVAVAGVSENKMNMGRIILNNVAKAGFEKENLFVLKALKGEIDGIKCFARCSDFPKNIDMLVITVPSNAVADVLKDVASSGNINGVVLISGGMGEKKGTENIKKQIEDIIKQAKQKNPDFVLSGGNSLGIVSNPSKVNTLFIPKSKMPPPLGENPNMAKTAFISQSGAFLINATSKMPWFKPDYSVSVGNQMDITVVDYLCEVCSDENIKVVLGYIEGIKPNDGTRLITAVKSAIKLGKKVVLYKAGRTPEGQKSVMGHTASIAGSYTVFNALLGQTGAYIADTFEEFEDYVRLCTYFADFKPKTGRVYLMSNAGFEAAGMADNLDGKKSFKVEMPEPELTSALQNVLKKHKLDAIVDVKNPFDVTPMASDEAMFELTETILKSGAYDAMLISPLPLTPVMKTLPSEGLDSSLPVKLGKLIKKYKKPIVFCVASGSLYEEYFKKANENGLALFHSSDRAVKMLQGFFG